MTNRRPLDLGIWAFAFGYFACYVPYSALTKALSRGMLEKMTEAPSSGFVLLPVSASASLVGMLTFITLMGWWKYAGRQTLFGFNFPFPNRWTLFSGFCTACIIGTTTLAYTFQGVSIVFMMLLMRGGVLILAPVVDALSHRKVRWFSWVGLAFSMAALIVAFIERADAGLALKTVAVIDVAIYLASYFVRLRFMSRLAKSDDLEARTRYFVEEQMVATPIVVITLIVLALINNGAITADVRAGFTQIPGSNIFWEVVLVGLFSQGTGVFGGLVLLDKSENTYAVPVNRSSSIMAGVVATYSLHLLLGARVPSRYEGVGVVLIIVAILFLTVPTLMARKNASAS